MVVVILKPERVAASVTVVTVALLVFVPLRLILLSVYVKLSYPACAHSIYGPLSFVRSLSMRARNRLNIGPSCGLLITDRFPYTSEERVPLVLSNARLNAFPLILIALLFCTTVKLGRSLSTIAPFGIV